jgi:tetrahydromethanopterin S-methyltransferase subunit F
MDSGYDDKEIQNTIISRGWDFICSLKCNRSAKSTHNPDRRTSKSWKQIRELFRLNVRTQSASKKKIKRKTFRIRRIEGFIKGVILPLVLVCSKKIRGKGNFYFACSNLTISTRSINLGYAVRWRIELFHRDSKQYLGMMEAGVHNFDSLVSHVHWVYCAYLLLKRHNFGEAKAASSKWRITRFSLSN